VLVLLYELKVVGERNHFDGEATPANCEPL